MRKIKVLLVEDDKEKRENIEAEVNSFFKQDLILVISETLSDATQKILTIEFDLIIMDLLLPRRDGDIAIDVTEEIVDHYVNSEINRLTIAVAISQFDETVDKQQSHFMRAGIMVVKYSNNQDWQKCLNICMQRVASQSYYDFVIICALNEERSAFESVEHSSFKYGSLISFAGLDGRELSIGEHRGICILQPQMGLVDASIIATMALQTFTPSLICMSGICAGVPKNTQLGKLIVSDYTWEHQAGKWQGNEFSLRNYHEHLDPVVRTSLNQLIEGDPYLEGLATKPNEIQLPNLGAELAPSVSGSVVIASDELREKIAKQHGKVAAIDMEVYGVYRSACLYSKPVKFFAAKTVVDLASEEKGDSLHHAGAVLSARFTIRAIEQLLSA